MRKHEAQWRARVAASGVVPLGEVDRIIEKTTATIEKIVEAKLAVFYESGTWFASSKRLDVHLYGCVDDVFVGETLIEAEDGLGHGKTIEEAVTMAWSKWSEGESNEQ